MRKYIIVALFILVGSHVFSAIEKFSERIEGPQIVVSPNTPVLTLHDDKFYDMSMGTAWQTNFANYKVTNTIRLGINPEVPQTNDLNGSIDIQVKLWKWDNANGVFVTSTVNQTLSLSFLYTQTTAIADEIATYVDQGAHKVEVYITAINGGAGFDVNDVYLSSEMEVERYYTLNIAAAPVVGCHVDPTNSNYYEFYWGTRTGAEYYELEWIHVSDASETGVGTISSNDINYNYYLNSTRVNVIGNSYRIPRIFDNGYFFYRIRAIGLVGTNFDLRQEGTWSNTAESGSYLTHNTNNKFQITSEYDSQMNWSHQVSYGDNGERFESVSFVDGLGRERQGVTHNTETKQAVVSNVYYDNLGRPVITDLPTPVDGEQLKHYPNFNLVNGTNASFKADNFNAPSSTSCAIVGSQLSTSSGAGQYYSPQNQDPTGVNSMIPDAEKYPYARVQYKDDFTGRVSKASGVGEDLRSGGTHETVMGYASANQKELDRLFGAEVGKASHYQKMVTIDANGQVYVQYMDMAGRTIASGLAGDAPSVLDQITGNGAVNVTTSILPENDQTIVAAPASATLTYTEFITQNSSYAFSYAFTPQQFHNACMVSNFCLDCAYDMSIKIVDECGDVKYANTQTMLGTDADNLCNAKAEIPLTTPGLNLVIGEYIIVKTLAVNQTQIENKWCDYIEQATCDGSVATKFNQLYNLEEFEACIPNLPVDEQVSECENYKEVLLADMMPGGQYGKYVNTNGVYTPLANNTTVHSFLTEDNLGTDKDWKHPSTPYLNADNTTAYINGVLPQNATFQEFIENFQPSWANSLLPYHPEYCFYQFCIANQTSLNYDAEMRATYSQNTGCPKGYFKPLASNSVPSGAPFTVCTTTAYDPFFATGGLGSGQIASDMNAAMNNYQGTGVSIWQYAIFLAVCDGVGNPSDCRYVSGECKDDAVWVTFRSLYLDLKAQYVYQVQMSQSNCSNAQIGVGNWSGFAARFGNVYAFNNFDPDGDGPLNPVDYDIDGPGSDTGQAIDETYINSQITAGCQTACTEYADEWIAKMSGCEQYTALSQPNKDNFKNSLITLCMSGCNSDHPQGATTAPPGSSTPYASIDAVMLAYFGTGYEDNLCTSLLISEPAPYQSTTDEIGMLSNPLDVCACEKVLQANNDFLNKNPNNLSLEQILALNTGVSLEDANVMYCKCKDAVVNWPYDPSNVIWIANVNTVLTASGIEVSSELSCTEGNGCTDCTVVGTHVSALNTRFTNFATSSNYEVILTNYLNNKLLFHLSYFDYQEFIDKCAATTANPYCTVNPLMSEWSEVMTLLTFRGQLLNTSSNPINLLGHDTPSNTPTNIVYSTGKLKDKFLYDNYWSSQTSTTLTAYFGSTTQSNCNFTLTLPTGATYGFADIVSFGVIEPLTTGCVNPNSTFKVRVGYLDCGKMNYGWLTGSTTCIEVNKCVCSPSGLSLCDEIPKVGEGDCYQPRLNEIYSDALNHYLEGIDEVYAAYKTEFNTACAAAFSTEKLSYLGPKNEYQYTLYFYDQAGNLVKTVAPKGNNPLTFNTINVDNARNSVVNSTTYTSPIDPSYGANRPLPAFDYETKYKYNSYNQLVSTTNPDQEGETKFWYDRYGRIVASQNPVQADEQKYSYSLYDAYGRPVEVGQADLNGTQSAISETIIKTDDNGASFKTWVYGCVRSEVTFTLYDKALNGIPSKFTNGYQENLRLRVASVFYFATVSGSTMPQTGYESATHYSYDIHGNVKEQLQDVPALVPVQQDIKSTQYDYSLLSGNMKKVEYQKGKRDQMTHEYEYDKLYRLTEVFTSTDGGVHKSREAHYRYYDYGPLARVELGQHKVQGQDFAYTINGWIKGMNSTTLKEDRDGGKDATTGYTGINNARVHELVAKDAVGYSLGYFQNDYQSIAGTSFEANPYANIPSTSTMNPYGAAISNLYNGNIAHSETAIEGFEVLGSAYRYDQLQQIKNMRVFRSATLGTDNSWASSAETNEYASDYTYDQNGNLINLNRKATTALGLNMDQFSYAYTTVAGKPSNRLNYVTDGAGTTASISDDIEPGQATGNYTYDKLGQLTNDVQTSGFSTGTQTIFWRTGDKKIQNQITQTRKLEYIYNTFGQRVIKIEKVCVAGVEQAQTAQTPWKYTYYGYDANGQVMATYSIIMNTAGSTNYTANVDELNIYGAGRIGLIESGKLIYNNGTTLAAEGPVWINQLGNKRYELTNHLGNVNAVITDRKQTQATTYTYTVNTFNTTTESWAVNSPTTITQNNGQIDIQVSGSTQGVSNVTYKTFPTIVGQEYDVQVNLSCVNTGMGFTLNVSGSSSYTITNGVTTSVTFTATSTSTTLTLQSSAVGSFMFSVQDLILASHAKYEAVAIMKADYYPFGMQMPGRQTNTQDYRFGYNGMEKDKEIKGDGNSYTTEFRQYDPRLGRWLSLDPLMAEYSSWSPYVAFENNPIYYKDPYGLAAEGSKGKDKGEKVYKDSDKSADRWIRKNTRKGNILPGATKETDKDGNTIVHYEKAYKSKVTTGFGYEDAGEYKTLILKKSKTFKQKKIDCGVGANYGLFEAGRRFRRAFFWLDKTMEKQQNSHKGGRYTDQHGEGLKPVDIYDPYNGTIPPPFGKGEFEKPDENYKQPTNVPAAKGHPPIPNEKLVKFRVVETWLSDDLWHNGEPGTETYTNPNWDDPALLIRMDVLMINTPNAIYDQKRDVFLIFVDHSKK